MDITKEQWCKAHRDAEATFRAAYEQYTGLDPYPLRTRHYNRREEIEGYARCFRLADHIGGAHTTFDGLTSRDYAMWFIASSLLCAVRQKISSLPSDVQLDIADRVRALPDPPNIGPARADARHYRRIRRTQHRAHEPPDSESVTPAACERARQAHVAAVEANDAAERSEERRRALERSSMAAQERARRKAMPERPLTSRDAARPSQRSTKKAAREARRANRREPTAALEHEVFQLPEQRELRTARFVAMQARNHDEKLERKERERADARSQRALEVSAAQDDMVPSAPTIAAVVADALEVASNMR